MTLVWFGTDHSLGKCRTVETCFTLSCFLWTKYKLQTWICFVPKQSTFSAVLVKKRDKLCLWYQMDCFFVTVLQTAIYPGLIHDTKKQLKKKTSTAHQHANQGPMFKPSSLPPCSPITIEQSRTESNKHIWGLEMKCWTCAVSNFYSFRSKQEANQTKTHTQPSLVATPSTVLCVCVFTPVPQSVCVCVSKV